jgi:NTE family protein
MEGDVPEETVLMRSDLRIVLGALPLFNGLDEEILKDIALEVDWLSLPGGATLFETGEDSDALYIVLSGCLAVFAAPERKQGLGRVLAGDTVGEMGLISGRPRSATVIGLRDSELARLSRAAFDRVFGGHPEAMLRIAQLTVNRLEAAQTRGRTHSRGARTFTIVPQSLDLDAAGFASEFVKAMARLGRVELVWSVRGATHTSHWFHRIESVNDFVVYVADPGPTSWSSLCVRQADALLLLARADAEPGPWPALSGLRNPSASAQRAELVLLHDDAIVSGGAARWLNFLPRIFQTPGATGSESVLNVPHHHVTGADDVARVARLLTGHANGIVLSGGGARGFAHIGIFKALREAGIVIDLVGGTSLGSIMGAAVAAGWSVDEMTARFRRAFVDVNPIGDYTLPLISLTSGRRVSRLLHSGFGDVAIEDLPLPFYCVSSNLTTGHSEVHRRGTLWRWLRASVSIPGVLPPVMNHGDVLVDGATMNNLPVDIMRELGRGPVIGCDVGADRAFTGEGDEMEMPPLWRFREWLLWRQRRPNIVRILLRAGMVNSSVTTLAHRDKTDLLLQPPLAQIDMLNWKAFDRAIAAGYEYTARRLAELPADSPVFGANSAASSSA